MKLLDNYIKEIEKEVSRKKDVVETRESGTLLELKDGVAIVEGLYNAFFGEIVEFENGIEGFIIDLSEDTAGVIIFGNYLHLKSGLQVKGTGKILSIEVGNGLIGKIIDPLSKSLDRRQNIKYEKLYPIERIAPGVVKRQPVNTPVQTGIKAIDALVPIGRGQRELIIGDRITGKSTIAIDTIINQKDKNLICIYCAIGQKNSKVASVIETLTENNAMGHTIVVSAGASDPVSLQYIAPYSATAIGEYFMDKGKDVLIVYDDLTKHAWAYRQLSLVLRRPAGREAYPGDVFYLHSRLLERACRLNKENGGGSITALPIVETLEGDISGYIPTNIISITDGQLFLETDLFNSGIRPAISIGLSVSRVGGNAQTKAIKQVSGRLKLDLAQYRELAAFSQFESELEEETKKQLNRGTKITQILVQNKNKPFSLAEEVCTIWAATQGYLDQIPTEKVKEFEEKLLAELTTLKGKDIVKKINTSKELDPDTESKLKKIVTSLSIIKI
ncbi:F0F1 ATP synthase subunit alpha [Candidatus Roizmanbacteria bacterium RIFCSPHIGHO2_12_FULL_33_9]|uniref:ATP synthase subunit alpha n=1 Tax=Candidatus Roizmanbacteria bacterium RIFCSPHIGHO2_12_FULL_33_9 TaxID=1802045 RepID=A0A1F7HJK2_9BACT|nr:MAG: F0F1 ATP synthase subunit alpha [Candidatus Roizmanbacteria bacterium RIFCSPHIGHO2_12_FULL_33_9]